MSVIVHYFTEVIPSSTVPWVSVIIYSAPSLILLAGGTCTNSLMTQLLTKGGWCGHLARPYIYLDEFQVDQPSSTAPTSTQADIWTRKALHDHVTSVLSIW